MPNEHVNKVILGTETLLDLTEDTAVAADVAAGKSFHLASGARTTGTASYAGAPTNNGNANVANAILYGAVDSTSTATAFTATVAGLDQLVDGTCVMLHNGVVTSAAGFTVNINDLGDKKCYNNMTNATQDTTIFNVAYTMMFVYAEDLDEGNGGFWIYRGYNSDNNTIGYQLRTNSTAMPTVTRTRYYRLLFTSADRTKWVPANTGYDNSATSKKTVNQNAIDPHGRIVYMTGTTNVNANANVGATVVWDRYTLNLGYSFNTTGAALTLTFPAPVFVKCAPQSNGSAIIDSTTPYVQALPSTADGKIYIYLGMAYSETNIELVDDHPVYEYKDGSLRLWTNAAPGGGGSTVTVTRSLTSGTKSATITVDSTGYDLYAPTPPTASTTAPSMDGTASYGSGTSYARADHVHPTDTSRQETLVSGTNIKTVNNESILGSGNIAISGGSKTTWYGTCSTSGTAAKVVTCDGFALEAGAMISVLFSQANTYGQPTLNVNGTGAKSVYIGNSDTYGDANPLKWVAKTLITFVYDGTQYRYIAASASASVAPPRGAGTWYGTCSTTATTATKTSQLNNFVPTRGALVLLHATTANTYTAGALKLNINGTGDKAIYKDGAATSSTNTLTWAADDDLMFMYDGSEYRYCYGSSTESGGSSVEPATANPVMDGTAAVGSSDKYAREDHVHPTDTSRAASSHDHGSITNAGAITSDTAAASGDKLVIADSSDSSKLKRSGIAFGSSTSTFLRNDGTWATPSGGGGGGGSWTDVSSLFTVVGEGGEEVRAITDGTLVYLSAYGGTIDYVQIPSEYTPICMSFGTALGDDQSTVLACYVDDGGTARAADDSLMFGLTVVYPIAIA